jgi:YdaS antitoxin of YdaST toxin-antitoxin system
MHGDSLAIEKVDLPSLLSGRGLKPVDLARLLGVDKSTVSRWSEDGVPYHRILDVERVTGISRADLRPDLAKMFGSAE